MDWGRLIPGGTPGFRAGEKKPARPVKPCSSEKVTEMMTEAAASTPLSARSFLLPGLMQSRLAGRRLRSIAADFALVMLNWLLIGALEVPLRELYPHVRLFGDAAGSPSSLLGIAILHAALITLLSHAERVHVEDGDQRGQACILGKSVFWANYSVVLCLWPPGSAVEHERPLLRSRIVALWRVVGLAVAKRGAEA